MSAVTRLTVAATACACTAIGAVLSWQYPMAHPLAVVLFAGWATCCFRWPLAWLLIVPAALPVTGFATWTGWFAFEELDLLVLGAAAGAYARLASDLRTSDHRPTHRPTRARSTASPIVTLLIALLAASYGIGIYRGISDAGGFAFDWIGSYDSAMNSLRSAKGFGEALLLLPLIRRALTTDEKRSIDLIAGGCALGMAGAAMMAWWERAAFPGLLNFSSDYRTTALFWEMHVGGAALDGFLALTAPFVVWQLQRSRNLAGLWLMIGLSALAAYACLTTFSRGVYVAVPVGLATLAALLIARMDAGRPRATPGMMMRVAGLLAAAAAASYFSFHHGGYRALLTLGATVAVSFWVAPASSSASGPRWAGALAAGGFAGAVAAAIAMQVAKGPYALFGIAFAWNAGLLLWTSGEPSERGVTARLAAFGWLIASAAAVALYWGGIDALIENVLALALLLGLTVASSLAGTPLFPVAPRTRAIALGALCVVAAGIVVFAGGGYMSGRFSTASDDLDLRLKHWRDGIGMLRTAPEWWLGKGLGRFPGDYLFNVTDSMHPGAFSLHGDPGDRFLTLAGPRYPTSWGDLFRIAQRVPPTPGKYTVILDVRSRLDTELHAEVCEQHLLYNGACATGTTISPASQTWQRISVVMEGQQLSGGSRFAPRLAFFAVAVGSSGQAVDIRNVILIGPQGHNLIVNGDFADGMRAWMPISERFHLPWHIKNLGLDLLFDQGIVGLGIFLLLVTVALWRLVLGRARQHPIAPYLAASVVGFGCVGAFDSLLDVPRIAFLFYFVLLNALYLPADRRESG